MTYMLIWQLFHNTKCFAKTSKVIQENLQALHIITILVYYDIIHYVMMIAEAIFLPFEVKFKLLYFTPKLDLCLTKNQKNLL